MVGSACIRGPSRADYAVGIPIPYAVSENHQNPQIGSAAAEWARDFATHQAKRMLYMAQSHVADNPFHAECLKFLRKLRSTPGCELSHSVLLKRMKTDAKTFRELVNTLEQRGDITTRTEMVRGGVGKFYRLANGSAGETLTRKIEMRT